MSNEDDRDEKHCLTIKELRDLLLQVPAEYDNAVVLARVTDSDDVTHVGDLRSGQIEYGCCPWPALILAADQDPTENDPDKEDDESDEAVLKGEVDG